MVGDNKPFLLKWPLFRAHVSFWGVYSPFKEKNSPNGSDHIDLLLQGSTFESWKGLQPNGLKCYDWKSSQNDKSCLPSMWIEDNVLDRPFSNLATENPPCRCITCLKKREFPYFARLVLFLIFSSLLSLLLMLIMICWGVLDMFMLCQANYLVAFRRFCCRKRFEVYPLIHSRIYQIQHRRIWIQCCKQQFFLHQHTSNPLKEKIHFAKLSATKKGGKQTTEKSPWCTPQQREHSAH